MGQSSSSHSGPKHHQNESDNDDDDTVDYTYNLPDECLALIFHPLSSGDRKSCSLVCRRWLAVEGQSRHRLTLTATSSILPHLPSLFSRFDSVTKLSLRCDRKSLSLSDHALTLISLRCGNLTRLKLRSCRDLTHMGLSAFARNCKTLKKFSCGSCMFGSNGINALLEHCSTLEELSVKRLRGVNDGFGSDPVGPGAAASSLRSICLKELYNGQAFAPLIMGSKNLKTLKLMRCLGDWDQILETIAVKDNCISEVHLERLQVSDSGLTSLSACPNLEILHMVKTPECTDTGVVAVAKKCKSLRKLHIDGWRTNRIGDEGLVAIAENSSNLKELVLIGLNPTSVSLQAIASNCQKLERLALCGSDTIGDPEVSCIATKCKALKKLCIKGCEVTDEGIESFALGCPNLVKIKVKKCKNVTGEVADWLRARRGSLAVNLDVGEVDIEPMDGGSGSDAGIVEEAVEYNHPIGMTMPLNDIPSTTNAGRSSVSRWWFSFFGGRGLVACTLRKWSSGNGDSRENLRAL